MATTYKLIDKSILVSSAASVSFTSIPATYTDLKLVMSVRNISTGSENWVYGVFNSDTSSNYSNRLLRGNGSTAASGTASTTAICIGQTQGSGFTASTFASSEAYIPNYTSSNQKSVSVDTVAENNATANYMAILAANWTGTAAITSITLTSAGNNFDTGSSFYLYGISKS